MKIIRLENRNRAMTLIELLTVVAIIALLAVLLYPALGRAKEKAIRVACVDNLRQTGLAFNIWSGDHGGEFPMAVPQTNGGSMEFITGPNVFRHFQVMSNELSTPKVLLCPAELETVRCATNFTDFANSNISYFVGVDARETNRTMILSGDRNITDGSTVKNGTLELTTNRPARWTLELHNKVGNILLADGSVQMVNIQGLQDLVANTGFATNRLQMP